VKDPNLSRDAIMRGDDKALYQAKSEGRGRYRSFNVGLMPDQQVA
jgi:PleD family two-component response regulator